MDSGVLSRLPAAVRFVADAFGFEVEDLPSAESLDSLLLFDGRIVVRDYNVLVSDDGIQPSLDDLRNLPEEAFWLQFSLEGDDDGLTVHELRSGVSDKLQPELAESEDVGLRVRLSIDKSKLRRLGNERIIVFRATWQRMLEGEIADLASLWQGDLDSPISVVVCEGHPEAIGELLAVGGPTANLEHRAPTVPPARYRELRPDLCSWDGIDHGGLTPAHVRTFRDQATWGDGHADLRQGFVSLFLRVGLSYLADQSRLLTVQGDVRYRFEGGSGHTQLPIPASGRISGVDNDNELDRIVRWVFAVPHQGYPPESDPAPDRHRVAQTVISARLRQIPLVAGQLQVLTDENQGLSPQVTSGWHSFIENKINAHTQVRLDLESAASETVEEYGKQADALLADLGAALRAGIATLLGSFVGAALSDKFNPTVFRIGTAAYGVYLAVLPGLVTHSLYLLRHRASSANAESAIGEFRTALGKTEVDKIVGGRIGAANLRFWIGWCFSVVVVIAVLIGTVVAYRTIPDSVAG